jgi:dihydrofolate synthase / folylpolyglutamate synthase
MRSLADWLERQERSHPSAIDLGLARVREVARRMGLLTPSHRVITVGGTNGKGSTVAFLDALLRAGGHRCGRFTSPHLSRYHERICIDGVEASDADLIDAFERIEAARAEISLTFFEWNTLAALHLFRRAAVQVAVLEVGLGGRLDATNIIDADVGVVCSIGRDHVEWLGDSLEQIGREKAGIFRPGRPAVLGSATLPASVFETIHAVGARAIAPGRDYHVRPRGQTWDFDGGAVQFTALPLPAMRGARQLDNAGTALAALIALDRAFWPSWDSAARGLREAQVRGRFQVHAQDVEWVLDVARKLGHPARAPHDRRLRHPRRQGCGRHHPGARAGHRCLGARSALRTAGADPPGARGALATGQPGARSGGGCAERVPGGARRSPDRRSHPRVRLVPLRGAGARIPWDIVARMDSRAKQRLTGAIILVALFVLLVPELLTGPKNASPSSPGEDEGMRRYTIDLRAGNSTAPHPHATPPGTADDASAQPAQPAQPASSEGRAVPGERAVAPSAETSAATAAPPSASPSSLPPAAPAPPSRPSATSPPGGAEETRPAPTSAPTTPAAVSRGEPSRYVVQLGSFGSRANADRLVRDMTARGFTAFIAPITTQGRELYRVRVGPTRDRASAEALAAQLKRLGQSGSIVPIP